MFRKRTAPKTIEQFPAGTYYIGDPCYPFPHEGPHQNLWKEWCDIMIVGERVDDWQKVFVFRGYKVASDCTAYGDGCYQDDQGNEYCVDSGSLGILPIDFVHSISKYDDARLMELGTITIFEEPFTVEFDNGKFTFGHLVIDTVCDDENEAENDYWANGDDEDNY